MAKRKNIAVFIPHIYSEFPAKLRKAIENAAKGKGYRLVFFTCFGDNSNIDTKEITRKWYDEGERAVFRLANVSSMDGLIILYDAFSAGQWNEIRDMLINRCKCPIINFRSPLGWDGIYNIYVDDKKAFAEMIQHFIDVHQCHRIDLVTGPKNNIHSHYRLEIYQEVLKKNHIPFEEKRVHRGNFWKNCGEEIVEEILNSDLEQPEAIVCANDYMAMSVIDALRERKIAVPKQILVSGYDDIEESRYNHPALSTVRQPIDVMGKTAIEMLEKIWAGESVEHEVYLPEEVVCRGSCGCRLEDEDFSVSYSSVLNQKLDQMIYLENAATTMVTMMSNAANLEESVECLKRYALRDTGFKSFALCMAEHWEKQLSVPEIGYGESMCMIHMVMGIHKGKTLEEERFPVCQLLPKVFARDEDTPIYVVPIHHLQYYMGYVLVQLDFDVPNCKNMESWLMHLANALENIRMRDRLSQVVKELGDLYVKDTLTGLYNRRGLEKYGDSFYAHCMNNNSNFMIMEVDMDGLKLVNDQYGHDEGDICITTIANGLVYAAQEEEICIRSGGDEYIVLGQDYTQEKIDSFMQRFEEFMESANKSMNKPYQFGASSGYFIGVPDGVKTIENYLKIADDRMYENKKKRKAISHPGVEVR